MRKGLERSGKRQALYGNRRMAFGSGIRREFSGTVKELSGIAEKISGIVRDKGNYQVIDQYLFYSFYTGRDGITGL